MTDYPIIMSAPMVRALLDGHKTQTRRLAWSWGKKRRELGPGVFDFCKVRRPKIWQKVRLGDRLWVRETHALLPSVVLYKTGLESMNDDFKWRRSIHMPRWASRLTLTVTETRRQRVQEISVLDCYQEAALDRPTGVGLGSEMTERQNARREFRSLWNSLHGPDAWDSNPEVVALTFTVALQNIGPKDG